MSLNYYQSIKKSFYIEHLGCAKNQVDAEIMIETLINSGYTEQEEAETAEVVIINTCGFIGPAKEETIEVTLTFRAAYPDKKIVLAGCFAERYKEQALQQLPEVDAVFGNRDPSLIREVFARLEKEQHFVMIPEKAIASFKRSVLKSFPGTAYIKLSEGCRHGCSFCAIPVIRGTLRSRTVDDVFEEIKDLLTKGIFEFNLIAQDLASFGYDRGSKDFLVLMYKLEELKEDFWIRFLYIHPDFFPIEILNLCKRDKRFLPYFDIPFQHASRPILKQMGRRGSKEDYIKLIKTIRKNLPDAVIRSSLLVGFPGETQKDFLELLDFQEKASLDWAGVFTYSREEDTRAFTMGTPYSRWQAKKKALKRKQQIELRQQDISSSRLNKLVGRELTVIVEEPVKNEPLYFARAYFQAPEVDGLVVIEARNLTPGQVVTVKIEKINGIDCKGVVVE